MPNFSHQLRRTFRSTASPRFTPVLTRPELWLTVAVITAFYRLHRLGSLIAHRTNDTRSYEWPWELMSFDDMLLALRTFAYPIFLKVWDALGGSQSRLPIVHVLIYFGAVVLFWHALSIFADSKWLALAAAVPLLVADIAGYARLLQPELLAPAVVLVAVAALLRLVMQPRSIPLWVAVLISVTATYHVRPNYIFMVILIPLAAAVLSTLKKRPIGHTLRFATIGAMVCILPVLAYGTLRWVRVGQFGVVNLMGYGMIGITANFLDEETVSALPEEHRWLGRKIHYWREIRGWSPYTESSSSPAQFRQLVKNQWSIAAPLAWRLEMRRRRIERRRLDDPPPLSPMEEWHLSQTKAVFVAGKVAKAVNDRLQGLSNWLLERNRGLYYKWIRDAFAYGVKKTFSYATVRWSLYVMLASAAVWGLSGRWRRHWRREGRAFAAVLALWAVAIGYLVGSLGIMALVSYPIERYMAAAVMLLPSAMVATSFVFWAELMNRRNRARPDNPSS